jgi:hypothetical protein
MRRATLLVAVVAVLLLLLAGPGVRTGLWTFRTGFHLLQWAAYLGIVSGAAALMQLVVPAFRGPPAPLLATIALGLVAAGVPWFWRHRAEQVPPIHDITTDVRNPPKFVAVLPLRAKAPNPVAYGGHEVAEAQEKAYPDIRPLSLPAVPPGAAYARALAAVRAEGWELVAADSADGRIEATATTAWFGFKDDVVVRIQPDGAGSRLDVRSLSRVGGSDVGTNARRIREYLRRVAGLPGVLGAPGEPGIGSGYFVAAPMRQKSIPPACCPTSTLATRRSAPRSITSTAPGSDPTPSWVTNAYRLSGEITNPLGTRRVVAIRASSLPLAASNTDTDLPFLLVARTRRPSALAARL